jgi:hypothetical protein
MACNIIARKYGKYFRDETDYWDLNWNIEDTVLQEKQEQPFSIVTGLLAKKQRNRRWLQAGATIFRLLQNIETDSGNYPVTRYNE